MKVPATIYISPHQYTISRDTFHPTMEFTKLSRRNLRTLTITVRDESMGIPVAASVQAVTLLEEILEIIVDQNQSASPKVLANRLMELILANPLLIDYLENPEPDEEDG